MGLCELEKSQAGLCVIDDRRRIVRSCRLWCFRWLVDPLRRHLRQLGDPLANVLAVGIELLALRRGVEDAEVRLRITSAACCPLPAEIVARPVAVDEPLHVVSFALAEIDQ